MTFQPTLNERSKKMAYLKQLDQSGTCIKRSQSFTLKPQDVATRLYKDATDRLERGLFRADDADNKSTMTA